MIEKEDPDQEQTGAARPGGGQVRQPGQPLFAPTVKVIKDNTEIDGKSILGILTLAATQGTPILLRISRQGRGRGDRRP